MPKPLSNPFRPASSRNLKPSCETDEFAWSAVSETNFHHAAVGPISIQFSIFSFLGMVAPQLEKTDLQGAMQ